jgi:hypothetical protein
VLWAKGAKKIQVMGKNIRKDFELDWLDIDWNRSAQDWTGQDTTSQLEKRIDKKGRDLTEKVHLRNSFGSLGR